MDLIHGDDWGNKTIENDFPPFTYSRSACKEDCVMVSIDMIMKFPYLVDTDKMKELLDIAYYLKVCSCIDPIVISIDEAGRYKVLSGQKTIMACMMVKCFYVSDSYYM